MDKLKKNRSEEQIRDSARLRELFKERARMGQLEFGQNYDIGNQGMVWQYLNADKPKGAVLNVEAAIKFAKGLDCRVSDFSPTLQQAIDRIAEFASNAPRASRVRNECDEDGKLFAREKQYAQEIAQKRLRDTALLDQMMEAQYLYQFTEPERRELIDFLLQDEKKPIPPWVDSDAKAYIDSLEMKIHRWRKADKKRKGQEKQRKKSVLETIRPTTEHSTERPSEQKFLQTKSAHSS